MRHRSLCCTALPLIVACADGTAPELRATVVVQSSTVIATVSAAGSIDWMRFTLPVAIYNGSRRLIRFEYCASAVEKAAGSGWRAVWTPICSLSADSPAEIQPGETRELSLDITAAVDGPGGPRWDSDEINGTYRFRAGLVPDGYSGVIPGTGSNTFVLVER
jgi:hypothetical protein